MSAESERHAFRPRARLLIALGAVVVLVLLALLFRVELLLSWKLRQLTRVNSQYVLRDLRNELPADLRLLEKWVLDHRDVAHRVLRDRLATGKREEKIVAFHLLWKIHASLEVPLDRDVFWDAFTDRRCLEERRTGSGEILVYGGSYGVHALYETGALLVRPGLEETTVWHVALDHPGREPERIALLEAERRLRDKRPGSTTIRRWILVGDERERFDRMLARAACLAEFSEFESLASRSRFCHLLTSSGHEARLFFTGCRWLDEVVREYGRLAHGPRRGSEVLPHESGERLPPLEIRDFLLTVIEMAPNPIPREHAVFGLCSLDADLLARPEVRVRLEKAAPALGEGGRRLAGDYWLAAARHLAGDSAPLRSFLESAASDWPPLDDPRLGALVVARPQGVLPAFLLRLTEVEASGSFAFHLAGLALDSFGPREVDLLTQRVVKASATMRIEFLKGALLNPRSWLDDVVIRTLTTLSEWPDLPADYLFDVTRKLGVRPGDVSWGKLLSELEPLSPAERRERLKALGSAERGNE